MLRHFHPEHDDTIRRAKLHIPSDAAINRIASFFAALKDPTRLRIIYALAEGELCVCDLLTLIDVSPAGISQHLKALKRANIIESRKVGLNVFYTLIAPNAVTSIRLATERLDETKAKKTVAATQSKKKNAPAKKKARS